MGYVRCANRVCTVQHAGAEDEAVTAPASLVLPFLPNKGVACIAFAGRRRHDGAHQHCDEASSEDEEESDIGQSRQSSVGEHDDGSRQPRVDEIHDEDVPALVRVSWVEQTIHTDDLVGEDGRHGCGAKEPAKEVPPTIALAEAVVVK